MPTFVLTDSSSDVWVKSFSVDAPALGLEDAIPWKVTKEQLRGGRREGVDLIVVDNGALRFSIIPTRGMGLWKGWLEGDRLGWDSPVTDGPIHPSFVDLQADGGLGWLQGFDELMVRCGLTSNGAPYAENDPSGRVVVHGLHGRIANVPAHYVAVHLDEHAPQNIVVEGHVDETRLFGPAIRLVTRISTRAGSNWVVVEDEFVNLSDRPMEMQILYHWNFGPPYLGEGSRFLTSARRVIPRDVVAQRGLAEYEEYRRPTPGFQEEVFYHEPLADEAGECRALLRDRAGAKGVVLCYRPEELPAFTLWKNTGGLRDGYVTGLEPGVNYPNPRPFEKARARVLELPPEGRKRATTTLYVLASEEEVASAEGEIRRVQQQCPRTILPRPIEPFAAER